ncbi:MAG: peptidylprolyl isomerase, partial [candidate division Zixibacteria bacterium]|nr:peptidylprolyl isomerase [candidate division Zixibacteria bacterium]
MLEFLMYRLAFITILAVIVEIMLLVGCGGPAPVTPETYAQNTYVVAEIPGELTITGDELYRLVYGSPVVPLGGPVSDSIVQDILDSVLIDTLAGLSANNFDITPYWATYRTFKDQRRDLILQAFWEEEVYSKVSADTSEVTQFFNDSAHLFSVEEQVQMYHILCSPLGFLAGPDSAHYKGMSEDERWAAAREYAYNLYQMLKTGEAFENVAYEYSHDAMAQRNSGYVGWTKRGVYFDPFDSIAFSLEPGTFSEPYRDRDGYHLIMSTGRMAEGVVPIDSPGVFQSAAQTLLTVK